MPKISNIHFSRGRSDGIYVFASAFALIGSFILLSSYAARNPAAGSTSGTYTLSDFATPQPNSFSFSMKSGLSYCFPGLTFSAGQEASLDTSTGTTVVPLTETKGQPPCFTAPQSYTKVTVTLPSKPSGNELIVR